MRRALACISPASKRKLAARWKEEYADIVYQELLKYARNKSFASEVAHWDLSKDKPEGMV
jgi:hypothetical protein